MDTSKELNNGEAKNGEDSKSQILSRLQETKDVIKEIQKLVRTPSISYGVMHQGEIIYYDSIGTISSTSEIPPDANTLYPLASVSKNFLSALAGIAVSEGKLSWTAPVSTYLPDFNPVGDLEIGKKARILDCLRHSAGVGTNGNFVWGPGGALM